MPDDSWLLRSALWLNLLLWLAATGIAFGEPGVPALMRGVVAGGLIFSAVVEHWAYNRRRGVHSFRLWPPRKRGA